MISWKAFPVRLATSGGPHFETDYSLDQTTFAISDVTYECGQNHWAVGRPVTEPALRNFLGNLKEANEQMPREWEARDRHLSRRGGQS
ncbi:hypothetical protein V1281_004713 [Nitrobacteraceae bacterium AZCC 2161]